MNKYTADVIRLKKKGNLSNRAISALLGCSHTLVNRILKNNAVSIANKLNKREEKTSATGTKLRKQRLETVETYVETRPKKLKKSIKGVKKLPISSQHPNSIMEDVETKKDQPSIPVRDDRENLELAITNYYFSNYCKEMNTKLQYVLNALLDYNGKLIAKKRIEELLAQATNGTFEKNYNYKSGATGYEYNDFFKQVIIQLRSLLKQNTYTYQIEFKCKEEDIKKMKDILYILEKDS